MSNHGLTGGIFMEISLIFVCRLEAENGPNILLSYLDIESLRIQREFGAVAEASCM